MTEAWNREAEIGAALDPSGHAPRQPPRAFGVRLPRLLQRVHPSIAARLHLGFGLVLLMLLAVGATGWVQTGAMSAVARQLVEEHAQRETLASDMQIAVQDMVIVLGGLREADAPDEIKRLQDDYRATVERYTDANAKLARLSASSEAAPWSKPADAVHAAEAEALPLFDKMSGLAGTVDRATLTDFYSTQVSNPQAQWMDSLATLRVAMGESMSAAATESSRSARVSQWVTVVMACVALTTGLLFAILISRSITRPLRQAVALSRRVAQGDVSAQARSHQLDEVGALLNALADMQDGLRRLVGDVRQCADSIGVASDEVAAGNSDLSGRTERTAGKLQETASSLQELTGAVQQSAASAAMANQLASSASQTAQRGGQVVEQVVANMDEISAASRRIADILGLIDGIAFQTNILALNAAVEAARAGEQGRGFAVVAAEVRALAQRSANAAGDIKRLIDNSVERVQAGTQLVRQAGDTMTEITSAVRQLTDAMENITAATAEQSSGIAEVHSAVALLDQATQQNAALVEQSAAASECLRSQSAHLNALMTAFRLAPDQEQLPQEKQT